MTTSTAQGGGDARGHLLARLLTVFGDGLPPPGMSLREVATRAETSHALLRYHFGSLSGVLAAMLTAQRSRDNETLLTVAQQGSFDELVVAIWRAYTDPGQLSRIRGFFHVVGLAAHRPEDFREFIESLDDLTAVLASLAEREGHDTEEALNMATVAVAAIRGLLLQQVLTQAIHSENVVALIPSMSTDRCAPRAASGP